MFRKQSMKVLKISSPLSFYHIQTFDWQDIFGLSSFEWLAWCFLNDLNQWFSTWGSQTSGGLLRFFSGSQKFLAQKEKNFRKVIFKIIILNFSQNYLNIFNFWTL